MNKSNLYTVGGTIPTEGRIYIEREADEELLALCRAGSLAYVLAARQVGKSSLMVQTAQRLEAEGTRCASVDLTLLGTEFEGAEWYLGLLSLVEEALELSTDLEGWWEDHAWLSGTQRLVTFFQNVVVQEVPTPLVIFLDEIDSTLALPARADFFAAIRALYNARAQVPALRRLTFVLIGVATPSDLINDPQRTPFNIGQRVELTDFTLDEAAPLAEGFALPASQAQQLLAWSLKWTGGHPYLTQRLCVTLLGQPKAPTEESEVDQVVARSFFGSQGEQDHNLQFVRNMLTKNGADQIAVLSTYRDIRLGRFVAHDPQSLIQSHLKLCGIVCREGNELRIRNRIYEEAFNWQWIKKQLSSNYELNLYTVGGTVSASGKIYIPRQADQELLELCRAGTFAYVLAARQAGKSSLMVQTALQLEASGTRCALVDLSSLGSHFEGAEWYLGLLHMILDSLGLRSDLEGWWAEHAYLSGTQRLVTFFQKVIIEEITAPIVIFLDEIDSTFSLPVTSDFFAAIRALYNARTQVAALQRLTFVLMGVAAPGDLISDPKRTPFNIGRRVELTDFTLDEAAPLGAGLSLPADKTEQVLACLLNWTGGHPYLTQRLCAALLEEPQQIGSQAEVALSSEVERLVARTFFGSKSEEDNHLQFVRDMLTKRAPDQIAVLSTYRDTREGRTVRHDPQSLIQSHLKLSGIVYPEDNKLRVRNLIYEEVFDQTWIKEQWPLNWWQTLPRSVKIASGMMAVMFVALLIISAFAINQQQLALKSAQEAQQAEHQESQARDEAEEAARQESEARAEAEEATRKESQARAEAEEATRKESQARDEAEEAARQESEARVEAESQTRLALSQAKASETLLALSLNNFEQALLLARASVSYDTTNYPIIVSQALRQSVEETKLMRQVFHHPDVNSAAWSPDGQQLLTSGWDDQARILDATTGEPLLSLEYKGGWDSLPSWSPDGQQVLASSRDGQIQIWSPKGQLLQSIGEPEDPESFFSALMWSPDGQQVLTADDHNIQIWSQEGQLLQSFTADTDRDRDTDKFGLKSVTWSPDGTVLLTSREHGSVRIWSKTGELLHTLVEPVYDFYSSLATWSPDGTVVLTSSNEGGLQIWSKKGHLLHTLVEPLFFYPHVATWHPDGQQVAIAGVPIGGKDREVKIWEVHTGQLLTTLSTDLSSASSMAWSPDGLRLLIGTPKGTVQIWSQEGQLLRSFAAHLGPVHKVAWHPDGRRLLTRDQYDSTVRIWGVTKGQLWDNTLVWSPDGEQALMQKNHMLYKPATGQLLDLQPAPSDEIWGVTWSPNSEQVFTINQDGGLQIWQAATGELLTILPTHSKSVLVDEWSPNGQHLFVGSFNGPGSILWIWSRQSNEFYSLEFSSDGITHVAWRPDGEQFLTGTNSAQIWDTATGQLLHTLRDEGLEVSSSAWSPDGQQLFTSDGQIWDASTGKLLHTLSLDEEPWKVAWSPDGQRILTSSYGSMVSTVQIWDATTGQLLHTLKGHPHQVRPVAWSPNGQKVLTGSNDNTARIWDAATGESLHTLSGHSDDVSAAAWSPDGQKVLTGSSDNTARIWDATTGDLLSILEGDSMTEVRWSADGQRVLTEDSDWIVDESLLTARLTEVVCIVWAHDEEPIREEIPDWRGCEVELADVADDLAKYKALRGEK